MTKICGRCHGEGAVRNCECGPSGRPLCRCGWETCPACHGAGTVRVPDAELEAEGQLTMLGAA